MKVTIKQNTENQLLKRHEIVAHVDFDGSTPSNLDIGAAIGSKVKGEVVIKKVGTNFSKQEADVEAYVYDNPEAKEKFEMLTKHIKKKRAEIAKKAAEQAEAKAEEEKAAKEAAAAAKEAETPAEEKKEGEQ